MRGGLNSAVFYKLEFGFKVSEGGALTALCYVACFQWCTVNLKHSLSFTILPAVVIPSTKRKHIECEM